MADTMTPAVTRAMAEIAQNGIDGRLLSHGISVLRKAAEGMQGLQRQMMLVLLDLGKTDLTQADLEQAAKRAYPQPRLA